LSHCEEVSTFMNNSLDAKSRFSDRVADYIKYRPSYPDEFVNWLIDLSGIQAGGTIADIGSGTGISSKLFLDRGFQVIGIEPNDDMRSAAERLLTAYDDFVSIKGSAEETLLDDSSVDLVIAGQAFHWFDRHAFGAECKRILKPSGKVALFWNERLIDATEFLREYEALILKFATDYTKVDHGRMDDMVIANFFGKRPEIGVFPNVQVLDYEGLKGRLMSSSYVPATYDLQTPIMLSELRELFDRYAKNDRIELLYETKVYLSGSPSASDPAMAL
jgi:SAM-dependent methyltransferase